jgi:hypothetical protein
MRVVDTGVAWLLCVCSFARLRDRDKEPGTLDFSRPGKELLV